MPIIDMLKRASSYVLGGEEEEQPQDCTTYEDNEILFCKNNVCVHPPVVARRESDIVHFPGYITLTTKTFVDQYNSARRPTLLLTWIPNSTLYKCSSIANAIGNESPKPSSCVLKRGGSEGSTSKECKRKSFCACHSSKNSVEDGHDGCAKNGENGEENVQKTDEESQPNNDESEEVPNLSEMQPLLGSQNPHHLVNNYALVNKNPITSVNITIANPCIENIITDREELNLVSSRLEEMSPNWMTPELLAYKHNLSFPDSGNKSASKTPAPVKCRRFSVDLSQMRSLRLFFNNDKCTSGQLVIASKESQYKILHFHHGGLDHLAQVLHQWHCSLHNIKLSSGQEVENLPYRQFMVCRPEIKKSELHPDESTVKRITTNYFYGTIVNSKGQIDDDLLLRKGVFFGGLEKTLRKTVWPFLLRCYSFNSTFEDRAVLAEIKRQEYDEITRRRLYTMSPEESLQFWKSVQSVVEKDVVRTDRSNPYFYGEGNPNIEVMKQILLNYAYYNSTASYYQGMSDLLAPILCEIQSESDAFWCFVGLMQRSVFVCTPTDNDIDKNLNYLRELIRVMIPKLYDHLKQHDARMELLFCHRWLLLCFKREFTEAVVIRMWEACWSNYLTDYFHLFLSLAILAVYADDVIAQNLRSDEMLLHFSSLAMYMDGQLILRKARGLLHQYRLLPKIPCTLSGLCKRCGPGMWDSEHRPAIECVGHTANDKCLLAMD